MKVARELDIQIPQDLKVIGYDGTQFIETYTPELTTIQQPLKDIAILMVDLLLQKIEGKKVATTGYFLPVSLHSGKVSKTTPTVLYCGVIIRQKKAGQNCLAFYIYFIFNRNNCMTQWFDWHLCSPFKPKDDLINCAGWENELF